MSSCSQGPNPQHHRVNLQVSKRERGKKCQEGWRNSSLEKSRLCSNLLVVYLNSCFVLYAGYSWMQGKTVRPARHLCLVSWKFCTLQNLQSNLEGKNNVLTAFLESCMFHTYNFCKLLLLLFLSCQLCWLKNSQLHNIGGNLEHQ